MLWTLPNILTWIRIAAIPLIIVLFYMPYHWSDPAAGLLFAAAGITDSLDGYLARRLGQTSRLGAFLDPVADKLVVAVALVLLLSKDVPAMLGLSADWRAYALLALTAIVIIGREIAISALREWMAEIGARRKVAVSQHRQVQDDPADRRPLDDAVPLGPLRPADLFDRHGADGGGGGADAAGRWSSTCAPPGRSCGNKRLIPLTSEGRPLQSRRLVSSCGNSSVGRA